MTRGEYLRHVRERLGYTQWRWGEIIKATQASISAWECDMRRPGYKFVNRMIIEAEKLGINIDFVKLRKIARKPFKRKKE